MANVQHSSLPNSELHEPKGVSAASAGEVYVADGLGSGSWSNKDLYNPVYYDDLSFPLVNSDQGSLIAADLVQMATDGAGSQGVYGLYFSPTSEEEFNFTVQLPHRYKAGTDLLPHVHWAPSDANTGNVVWGFEYWVMPFGAAPATNTTNVTITDAAPGIAHAHQIASFSNITGTNFTESTIIACRFYRDATNAADTYASDAVALAVDIHFQVEKPGTLTAIPAIYY